MKAIQILATLILMTLISTSVASAQRINAFDAGSSIDTARHSVFLELSTGLVTNSLAINYEYQVEPHISLRLGAGAAVQLEGASEVGGTLGAQFFTAGDSRFEGGVGASLLYGTSSVIQPSKWTVAPAANIGYRYQPVSGGMMFRVGLSYSYNYGLPLQGSAGYSF